MPVVIRSSGREIFNCSSLSKTFNPKAFERSKFWLPKSFGYVKPCRPICQKEPLTAPKLKPYDPRTLKPWNLQGYNLQKIQTPEKFKDWNPGTLKLWKVWLSKSFWYVKSCSTISQKEQLQNQNPATLQPWNPKTLQPSNPETFKATTPKKFNPRKKSKTGILEPLNSKKCGFWNLFGM